MFDIIRIVIIHILVPAILSVYYSFNKKANQRNYDITKGIFYLANAVAVILDFFLNTYEFSVAGLSVTIAIMEGVPLIVSYFKK